MLNALGQRVKKSGTSITLFVYDESDHLLGEYDGSGNLIEETVWMGDVPVATLQPNGTGVSVYYIHTDHLNTPRRISRPSDNVIVWRWDSEPFGGERLSGWAAHPHQSSQSTDLQPRTPIVTTFTHTLTVSAAFVLLVLCMTGRAASAEALVMPRDLVDFAQTTGCSPVNDFFERPGAVDPPYVYGLLPGDKEESVAFWCKKRTPSDKPYLLLIKATNAEQLMGCPTKIEWWNYPRGLSLQTRTSLSLHDFHYVTEPKRAGPVSTISNVKIIVSEYDGVSESFVCYKGDWLFLLED